MTARTMRCSRGLRILFDFNQCVLFGRLGNSPAKELWDHLGSRPPRPLEKHPLPTSYLDAIAIVRVA